MIRLDEALAEYVAALVAAAPPLTPEQRDRLAALLWPAPRTPAGRAPSPVTSAGTASPGLSVVSRAHPTLTEPQDTASAQRRPLTRSAFSATPEASS